MLSRATLVLIDEFADCSIEDSNSFGALKVFSRSWEDSSKVNGLSRSWK
jgi:hypothetical protein